MSYGVALRNGVPFTLGTIAALCTNATGSVWSPLALWPDGIDSPGMWISPSTLPASFNDYTGTTPVATPGTVADSENPVGLALDIRAGAPTTLGPELVVNGDFAAGSTGWTLETGWSISGGQASISNAGNIYVIYQGGLTSGKTYLASFTINSISAGLLGFYCGASFFSTGVSVAGTHTAILVCGANGILGVQVGVIGTTASITNISFKEIPGNHMLQATSAARPLESAYDGQTLGPGNTYDATGYPIFQLYDGVDDGMATASFAAGTLINGMDCMIAVRRDSGANCVAGLYNGIADATKFFGMAESASGSGCVGSGAGTPTVWVDNTQLTGGTAVTRGTLHTALTAGSYHILEFRNLDLSAWTATGFGLYTSYVFPGARGDIMLFESTASTEDKDKARQYLADKYGVTLP